MVLQTPFVIEGVSADDKKPITNPRSIKDFAITKHAFRKAGPGALGEFQPGVRPPNLLIVFFWVDSYL